MSDAPELQDFRESVRAFLAERAPRSLRGTSPSGPFDGYWGGKKHAPVAPDVLAWRDLMLERGWTAPTWPRDYTRRRSRAAPAHNG